MPDQSERRLSFYLRKWLRSGTALSIRSDEMLIVTELRTLQGRPDITIARKASPLIKRSDIMKAGLTLGSYTSASLLSIIWDRKQVVIDDLFIEASLSERSIRNALVNLQAAGLVEIGGNLARRTRRLAALSVPIIAIEVKRSISPRAIFQAKQSLSFATRAYLGVWDGAGALTETQVESLGHVGVMAVSPVGKVTVLKRAKSAHPRNGQSYYYALGSMFAKRSVHHSGFKI